MSLSPGSCLLVHQTKDRWWRRAKSCSWELTARNNICFRTQPRGEVRGQLQAAEYADYCGTAIGRYAYGLREAEIELELQDRRYAPSPPRLKTSSICY